MVAVAVLTVLVLGVVGTAAALLWYAEGRIDKVEVQSLQRPGDSDGDGEVDPGVSEITGTRTILVVGSDSRAGLDREARTELGTGNFEGTRTDTIILAQLNPQEDSAALLSFPRDLLVTRCDGSQGRINEAFQLGLLDGVGGPECLVRTITDLTGIPINHYVGVDFQGFVDFVDRLGGVRLWLDQPISDRDAKIDLPAGCVTLDGREALGFVRVRKIDDDFGRIARQQRFIREVIDKLTSARIALDVPRLFSLVDAGARALDTDRDLQLDEMRRLAFSLRNLTSERVESRTVPGFNRVINGAALVVADEPRAEQLYAAFREGVAPPSEVGTEGPRDVKVGDVPPLRVLNGTLQEGLAAEVAAALTEYGFEVSGTANAPSQQRRRTAVRHPAGRAEEAQVLLEALGAGRATQADVDELTVVLGADADPERIRRAPRRLPDAADERSFAGADDEGHDC